MRYINYYKVIGITKKASQEEANEVLSNLENKKTPVERFRDAKTKTQHI